MDIREEVTHILDTWGTPQRPAVDVFGLCQRVLVEIDKGDALARALVAFVKTTDDALNQLKAVMERALEDGRAGRS